MARRIFVASAVQAHARQIASWKNTRGQSDRFSARHPPGGAMRPARGTSTARAGPPPGSMATANITAQVMLTVRVSDLGGVEDRRKRKCHADARSEERR